MKPSIVLVFASASILFSAEKKVQWKDLPAAVQQAIQKESVGATVRGYSTEVENGQTTYEAEMVVNGHGKDVTFDSNGEVVSVEEEVAINSIPAAARREIEKAASGAPIRKVEAVSENGKSFFEASFRKGAKSAEVQVDAQGNKVK